jgi:aldehyde dehydrogenase (NAD+)
MCVFERDAILVGSQWSKPASTNLITVTSPSTEEIVGRVPDGSFADIDSAVSTARAAFNNGPWPRMSVRERGSYLLKMADILLPHIDEIAMTQVDEMGTPFSFVKGGTNFTLGQTSVQIDVVDSIPTRMTRRVGTSEVVVSRLPMGVIGTVIPWNGPIPTLLMRIFPALLTGSSLVIKPPPESPMSAYWVAEAAIEAGLPEGVLSIVAGGRELGEHLVTHPGIDKVSFTGSVEAGRRVATLCGQMLRPATMELGGKSAAVILDDVDLDALLDTMIFNGLGNCGQVCYATTRLLVPRSRGEEIKGRLVEAVAAKPVGDPHLSSTFIGPVAAERQRDRVEDYIKIGQEEGAKVLLGGSRPLAFDRGWYVEPTVLDNVSNDSRVAREEIFGPVLSLIDYDTVDEAIRLANDSPYGLGGAVYSSDPELGLKVAERMITGTVVVNNGSLAGAGGPFGGMRDSGLGRERGIEGYANYYQLRSIGVPDGLIDA